MMSPQTTEQTGLELLMEAHARRAFEAGMDRQIVTLSRVPTGLSHFVYHVGAKGGEEYMVRLARPERNQELESGLYWQRRLETLGIPLPRSYHAGRIGNYAFTLYERLPGQDLEVAYPSLSTRQKREIAMQADTDFISYWCHQLHLSARQRQMVDHLGPVVQCALHGYSRAEVERQL